MSILKEFREFAVKGNAIDLAVGIVIGAAFGAVVKSLVDDLIMPIAGLMLGGVDLSARYWVLKGGGNLAGNETVLQAREAGAVVVSYGQFLNILLTFFIIAWSVFLIVKFINRLRRPKGVAANAPTTRECPACTSNISVKATRCPNCTSEVKPTSPV
jgi:large conductance mechanosensitive channel